MSNLHIYIYIYIYTYFPKCSYLLQNDNPSATFTAMEYINCSAFMVAFINSSVVRCTWYNLNYGNKIFIDLQKVPVSSVQSTDLSRYSCNWNIVESAVSQNSWNIVEISVLVF